MIACRSARRVAYSACSQKTKGGVRKKNTTTLYEISIYNASYYNKLTSARVFSAPSSRAISCRLAFTLSECCISTDSLLTERVTVQAHKLMPLSLN